VLRGLTATLGPTAGTGRTTGLTTTVPAVLILLPGTVTTTGPLTAAACAVAPGAGRPHGLTAPLGLTEAGIPGGTVRTPAALLAREAPLATRTITTLSALRPTHVLTEPRTLCSLVTPLPVGPTATRAVLAGAALIA